MRQNVGSQSSAGSDDSFRSHLLKISVLQAQLVTTDRLPVPRQSDYSSSILLLCVSSIVSCAFILCGLSWDQRRWGDRISMTVRFFWHDRKLDIPKRVSFYMHMHKYASGNIECACRTVQRIIIDLEYICYPSTKSAINCKICHSLFITQSLSHSFFRNNCLGLIIC